MRKIIIFIYFLWFFCMTTTQAQNGKAIKEIVDSNLVDISGVGEGRDNALEAVVKNSELYNKIWNYVFNNLSNKYRLLNDINLNFKTFQNEENSNTSLGFSYDLNIDYANFKKKNGLTVSNSFGLKANGNVAFKKELNPNNFLETNINYSYTLHKGGVLTTTNSEFFTEKNNIASKLILLKDPRSKEALNLWKEFGQKMKFSNQYTLNVSPYIGYETNQEFSKTQFTPTVLVTIGAKAWDDQNALARANIFDYPFALLRLLLKTDNTFTPYGSTIPTLQFGYSHVTPSNDDIREQLLNNTDPYPRFKVEAGFRTIITRIEKENIFFSSNFRYYKEINAPEIINTQNLNSFTYFVMALQSTSGLFVSYSTGRLPLDVNGDQVYALGFNYKF
jgi:hypothetical protein